MDDIPEVLAKGFPNEQAADWVHGVQHRERAICPPPFRGDRAELLGLFRVNASALPAACAGTALH